MVNLNEAERVEEFFHELGHRLSDEDLAVNRSHFDQHVAEDDYATAWHCQARRMLHIADGIFRNQFEIMSAITGGSPIVSEH